jgi:hypothetical protein
MRRSDPAFRSGAPVGGIPARGGVPIRRCGLLPSGLSLSLTGGWINKYVKNGCFLLQCCRNYASHNEYRDTG